MVVFHLLPLNAYRSPKIVLHLRFPMSIDGPALLLYYMNFAGYQSSSLCPSFCLILFLIVIVLELALDILLDTTHLAGHINNRAIGNAAFSHISPKLWNGLPIFICKAYSVQSFNMLKAHLFPAEWLLYYCLSGATDFYLFDNFWSCHFGLCNFF